MPCLLQSLFSNFFSFYSNTWITNRERLPNRELRNADDFYIWPHNYATLKRMQLFSFPKLWNDTGIHKQNQVLSQFLSIMKKSMYTIPAIN